jgi:PAS domain S-box-containing protein
LPKHIGLVVFLVFAVLASVLLVLDLRASFISQILTSSLNLVFRVGSLFIVAYISARSYLKSGALQLLLIGCSMIAFGTGSLLNIAGSLLVLPEWLNFALAIINISFLVFAALNLLAAGVLFFKTGTHEFRPARLKFNLFAGYFSAVLLMVLLGWLILAGIIPPFAVGREYTLARGFTLIFALALFVLSTAVMGRIYFESKSKVIYWYSLGLGLHVVSVSALLLAPGAGTALSWMGSAAQCTGSIFFIIALIVSFRGSKGVSGWAASFKRDKAQFEALFNNMNDAFIYCKILVDKLGKPVDWVFLDVNAAYERVSGYKKDQILGRRVIELFPDEQSDPANWIGRYGHVALTGDSAHFEEYRKSLKKWLNVSSYSPERGYFIALFEDISERKKAEEALNQAQDKLQEYAASLERLVEERTKQLKETERMAAIGTTAGMVGHDIRNPLQAITGDLFLAKSELEDLPDNEKKQNALDSLSEIEKNVDYINKIVADLQDYARPLNPRVQETDIKTVFNEILVKNGIPKNIKATFEIEAKAEKILADPDYLKRIASNLILNAVQAMPDGGKLAINAYTDKLNKDILITVKDTGIGIPENIKPKLFTPMMTTKSKGQGFGLAVVKRMTEGLGGTVTFESIEGKGTTFIIRLPPPKS